jgi:RND family efflux transporter MFP subunit
MNWYGSVRRAVHGGVLLGALVTVAACGGSEAAEGSSAGEQSALVLGAGDVAVAQRSEIAGGVVLTGSLNPYRVVDVRAQVPGTVTGLRVDRGQAVSQGAVMASLSAQGIRSQASGAQAGVAAAEANLALARRQLESARTLYEAGAMSEIDYRAAHTGFVAAQAQLAAARAQAATAGEAAGHTTIRAPITGEVSERKVEEGEAVNPGQSLFTVVNTDFLELAGQVPVDQAARIRPGQPVVFSLGAYPGRDFRGEVARVEPTANPATRQVGVYVRLPNKEHSLIGGLFATGRILAETSESAVVVPIAAVRGTEGQNYVWIIENGTAVRRPVTLGARDEAAGVVAIVSGLEGGEQVVISPAEPTEGARVSTAGTQPAPAAAVQDTGS